MQETSGQLVISLSPPEAIAAGAQWRRRYSDTWLDSGVTESNVPAGIWQIEFKEVPGWIAPERLELAVPANGTAEATAEYVKIPVDLFWGTYLGGSDADAAHAVATGSDGSVTVAGTTASGGWISGGGDALLDGATDAYVARLAADGSHAWSTYLGGTGDESGLAVSVDTPGNTYVTGATTSAGWVTGGWDAVQGGGTDGYLARLDATGALVWSTYLGGAGEDTGAALALDDDGNPHVAGATASGGWVSGGWNAVHAGGTDGFAAKFAPDGAHTWSTFLGGAEDDRGNALAVDATGSVYVAGTTTSVLGFAGGALPVLPAGGTDACIVRLDPLGQYVWHACLGGALDDAGTSVVVDTVGNVYAAGWTASPGWTEAGWDTSHNGGRDLFVAKLSGAGGPVWSTYLGGDQDESARGMTVDRGGNLFVTGDTLSAGWVSGGYDVTLNGGSDAFLVRMANSGLHIWSTCIGGAANDGARAVAVDDGGSVYVAGETLSEGWVQGGWDTTHNGGTDGFVARMTYTPPPTAPTNPGATDITAGQIRWTWQDTSTDETGFLLWADPGAGIPMTQRTTTTPNTGTWLHSGLTPNTMHTFQVAATSPWGDSERTDPYSVWTLAAVPAAPVVNGATGNSLNVGPGAGDGNPAGTEYALYCVTTGQWLDGGGAFGAGPVWQSAAAWGTVTVTGLAENTAYTFTATARNGAGVETAAGPEGLGWTLDVTPPVLDTVVSVPAFAREGQTVVLSFTSSEPLANPTLLVNALPASYSGAAGLVYSFAYTIQPDDPDGYASLVALGQDLGGNFSYTFNKTALFVDKTPPTGGVLINGGAAYTTGVDVSLGLTYDDGAGSGVTEMRFSHDGVAWEAWLPVSGTASWTLQTGDGPKTVHVQFRDLAGNETSSDISAGILLDSLAPTATVTLLDPTPTQAATLRYSVVFSEPVAPTFDGTDVLLAGALTGMVSVDSMDPDYVVTVTLTDVHPDGLSGVEIGTEVGDAAGNSFAGAVSDLYDVVYWPGFAAPLAGVTGYTGDAGPVFDAAPAAGAVRVPVYQWLFDRGTSPPPENGPATAAWDLGTLTLDEAGEYWCVVTYGGFTFETNRAAVELRDRISITDQPDDLLVRLGEPASFDVSATGGYSPLHYQWRKEGNNASGSPDAPSYSIAPTHSGDSGMYSVEVSDSHADSTLSAEARLTVETGVPAAGVLGLAALAGFLAVWGRRRLILQERGGGQA